VCCFHIIIHVNVLYTTIHSREGPHDTTPFIHVNEYLSSRE
jgi:hypothetical protein